MGECAFFDCKTLRKIYLECECEIDLVSAGIPDLAQVVFLSVTLPGGVRLQDLCVMKGAVIPDGVERIGNHWFEGSQIESITLPASVTEIGKGAFCNCWKLK